MLTLKIIVVTLHVFAGIVVSIDLIRCAPDQNEALWRAFKSKEYQGIDPKKQQVMSRVNSIDVYYVDNEVLKEFQRENFSRKTEVFYSPSKEIMPGKY